MYNIYYGYRSEDRVSRTPRYVGNTILLGVRREAKRRDRPTTVRPRLQKFPLAS